MQKELREKIRTGNHSLINEEDSSNLGVTEESPEEKKQPPTHAVSSDHVPSSFLDTDPHGLANKGTHFNYMKEAKPGMKTSSNVLGQLGSDADRMLDQQRQQLDVFKGQLHKDDNFASHQNSLLDKHHPT